MDFASKQSETYGWSDGEGLGKYENSISQALKPKLERSAAGVGYDPALKDHFDEEFVRTEMLTNGGSKVENVKESESEGEEEQEDVFKMTDEQLFKACEGRTAKGAGHGLLAIIAQQEAMLLTKSKFSGYSHVKTLKSRVVDEMNFGGDTDVTERKQKKKKRKSCNSRGKQTENVTLAESNETRLLSYYENYEIFRKKSKKSKRKYLSIIETIPEDEILVIVPKKNEDKTKKKKKNMIHL